MGRTRNGDPLIPDTGQKIAGVVEKPGTPRNAFTYDNDVLGTKCPFGAHIRRANPRNADLFGSPSNLLGRLECILGIPRPQMRDDLIASTRFHRILRRGREIWRARSSLPKRRWSLHLSSAARDPLCLHWR